MKDIITWQLDCYGPSVTNHKAETLAAAVLRSATYADEHGYDPTKFIYCAAFGEVEPEPPTRYFRIERDEGDHALRAVEHLPRCAGCRHHANRARTVEQDIPVKPNEDAAAIGLDEVWDHEQRDVYDCKHPQQIESKRVQGSWPSDGASPGAGCELFEPGTKGAKLSPELERLLAQSAERSRRGQ